MTPTPAECGLDGAGKTVVVAYLILAHDAPEQLARLVNVLPKESPIRIHFDRRADSATYGRSVELLARRPGLEFVTRHACRWGAFGIVAGTIEMMRSLIASGASYDHATLLSGADYPIKSNREIAAFLQNNPHKEFIESFLLTAPNRWSGHGGYFKTPEKMLGRHLRFRSRVLRVSKMRKLPLNMQPFGGSQWWTLTREAIEYIAEFVQRTPQFVSFCRYSYIPDESFFQTVVSNSHLASRVTGDDLRLAIWDRPSPPYPATLLIDDLDMLLASNRLFARKFDGQRYPDILCALDERNAGEERCFFAGNQFT